MNRKIVKYTGIVIYLLCFFVPVEMISAQTGIRQEKIGIEKAIQIALENNHDYKIAVFKEKEAGEKVNAAWGQLWPVLESEASAMRQNAESGFMSLSDGQNEIRFVQLKFGLNPGMFYHSLRASQDASKIAREEVRRIKATVEHGVVKGFFDVLLASEIVKLHQESIDVLNTNLRDVQNMYKTGLVPKFELLQAEVELHKHEPMLLEAKNNKKSALDMFNYILGSDKLEFEPDDAILKDESMKSPAGGNSKEEYLITTALKNRPELIQLEKKRNLTEHSKNINSSYYLWPTFSVGGYYGKTQYLPNEIEAPAPIASSLSNITGTDEWQKTWQIRVAATYRWGAIIPADPTRAAEREEKLKTKEAEEELLKLKRLIGISIRSNYSKLITSYQIIKSQKENVATAEEGLRVAKESYRAGIIKNSELLSVELSLNNARTSYINAIHGYYVSLAELKKEIGINDERIIMEDVK
ncbi:MAG: TolC family protein [Spirochaetes bacterium]|nr:TolC family protein [Spirochaetota bacterium]